MYIVCSVFHCNPCQNCNFSVVIAYVVMFTFPSFVTKKKERIFNKHVLAFKVWDVNKVSVVNYTKRYPIIEIYPRANTL